MRTLRLRVQTTIHFSREGLMQLHVREGLELSLGERFVRESKHVSCDLMADLKCLGLYIPHQTGEHLPLLLCKQFLVSSVYWSTMRSTGSLFSCLLPFFKLHDMGKRISFSSRDPNHCTGAHRTPKQNPAQQRVRTKNPSMMRATMSQRRCEAFPPRQPQ